MQPGARKFAEHVLGPSLFLFHLGPRHDRPPATATGGVASARPASRGPHHTGRRDPVLKGRRPVGFRISIMMCAVSYTSLPKRARRSLDTLLVFSCPMKGDEQVLTWEYCHNASMARMALSNLKEYECLVLETLQKKQSLFSWRADLLRLEDPADDVPSEPDDKSDPESTPAPAPCAQNSEETGHEISETPAVLDSPSERPLEPH